MLLRGQKRNLAGFVSSLARRFGSQASATPKDYDIIVSGAGAVGLAFAKAISHHPHFKDATDSPPKIAVLDVKAPTDMKILKQTHDNKMKSFSVGTSAVPDQRTSTLIPGSIKFLKDIGGLDHLNPERFQEYFGLRVWERCGQGVLRFNPVNKESEVSSEDTALGGAYRPERVGKEMGRTIENNHLVAGLYESLKSQKNVEFIFGDEIQNIHSLDRLVSLKSGQQAGYRLLVGSDGQKSKVKELSNIVSSGWAHNQKVCTVKLEHPSPYLWQRFIGNGPLAILHMWGNYSNVVWSVEESKYSDLMSLNDADFLNMLNDAISRPSTHSDILGLTGLLKYVPVIGSTSGRHDAEAFQAPRVSLSLTKVVSLANKRLSFPLYNLSANQYVKHGIALIGDAAHSIHPMAGQGLNLGILDANILANEVSQILNDGGDIGQEERLSRYEFQSKKANYTMQGFLEVLKTTYGLQSKPFVALRELGTTILDRTPLKDVFTTYAEGNIMREDRRLYLG